MLSASELFGLVLQYVSNRQHDQGILITGEWGAGKTYFLKHCLTPRLDQLRKQFPNKKDFPKKGVLYIPLNGITSIDDIRQLMFFRLYPHFEFKRINYVKHILQITSKFSMGINVNELLSLFARENQYLLCFDDLERIDCSLKSVLGFINGFIEHDGVKTIIICDENKILDGPDGEIYKAFKEKLIKHTYLFTSDIISALHTLIASYADSNFSIFMNRHHALINSITTNAKLYNIRTLNFAVSTLYDLYAEVTLTSVSSILEQEIVRFIISICFEHKQCKLDKDLLDRFIETEGHSASFSSAFAKGSLGTKEEEEYRKFIEMYGFKSKPLIFTSNSILRFVVYGYLDTDQLKNEIQYFINSNQNPEPAYLYSRGFYHKLNDKEFAVQTNAFLSKLKAGDIDNQNRFLRLCNTMSYYAICDLLPLNKGELQTLFISSLDIAKTKWKYQEINEAIVAGTKDDADFMAIYHLVMEANKELKKKECTKIARNLLAGPTEDLLNRVYSTETGEWVNPFFSCYGTDELVARIIQMSNDDLRELARRLLSRYRTSGLPNEITDELKDLKELGTHLKEALVDDLCHDNKLKCHFLKSIVDVIKSLMNDGEHGEIVGE